MGSKHLQCKRPHAHTRCLPLTCHATEQEAMLYMWEEHEGHVAAPYQGTPLGTTTGTTTMPERGHIASSLRRSGGSGYRLVARPRRTKPKRSPGPMSASACVHVWVPKEFCRVMHRPICSMSKRTKPKRSPGLMSGLAHGSVQDLDTAPGRQPVQRRQAKCRGPSLEALRRGRQRLGGARPVGRCSILWKCC